MTLSALCLALLPVGPTFGEILRVPEDYPTIRQGINAASQGDTVMVSPGTYLENDLQLSGEKTVMSTDPLDWSVVQRTIVDGNLANTIFKLSGSRNVLEGLTIQRGYGGINGSGASTVRRCRITGNFMYGISWGGGFPLIEDCDFIANTGHVYGTAVGLIANGGSPKIYGCRFESNSEYGIDIYGYASVVEIARCVFEGQGVGRGGVALTMTIVDNVSIDNCLFRNNGGQDQKGSGISLTYCTDTRITNCTSTGNNGSALHINDSDVNVTNCIFWGDLEEEISEYSDPPSISYSNIQGGWTGVGNIDADPLFQSLGGYNALLGPLSPSIDAGDPMITDGIWDSNPRWPEWYPNGEASDMGAYGGPKNADWIDF
jgi:hypothetical protein